jgi:ADP-ribosyl-[dinitrogen reductase] hydrolase
MTVDNAATRPVKTSHTHPLPIAAVPTPGGGVIGMTLCPGKRQPEAVTGPWDRDLAQDLEAIRAFGATTLVTLMETHELVGAQVPAEVMQKAALSAGLTWHHWPIVDLAAPTEAFERLWSAEAPLLCRTLHGGGKVLIHCRGGRGRSGLVAARLLIELGAISADAVTTVRAAQPLAIETAAQEEHVRRYQPILRI